MSEVGTIVKLYLLLLAGFALGVSLVIYWPLRTVFVEGALKSEFLQYV